MSMYSDDVAAREFVVTTQGYDRDEVRTYLEVIAREQQALRDEIDALREEQAGRGDVGHEIANLLEATRSQTDEVKRLAAEEAATIRARAETDADRIRQATTEATDRAREEADLYAFETRAAADREVRDKLRETNEKIEALIAGAAKVRARLFGIDTILASVRNEVAQVAESLDASEIETVETAELPAPPPPPAVIDLREVKESSNA